MIPVIVVAIYIGLSATTLWLLRDLPDRVDFMSGLLVGVVVYVQLPLLMMLFGGLVQSEVGLEPFDPYESLYTLFCLYLGWSTILVCNMLRTPRAQHLRASEGDRSLFVYVLAVYIGTSVVFFFVSGRAEPGHWQENINSALRGNSLAIFLGNLANVFRTILFGFIAYLTRSGRLSRRTALLAGTGIVVFDLLVTFNRITAMYDVILAFLVLYPWRYALFDGLAVLSPFVGFLSAVYATYRGLALVYGSDLAAKATALDVAWRSQLGNVEIVKHVQSLFEADNINIFKYITDNYGVTTPVLWGQTTIVRSVTVLLPSSIWSGKPEGFNTQVGLALSGNDVLALNATAFGELYGNFHILFPVALLALAAISFQMFRWLSARFPFADSFGFFVALAMWRFDNSFVFVALFFILLFLAPFFSRSRRPVATLAGPQTFRAGPRPFERGS